MIKKLTCIAALLGSISTVEAQITLTDANFPNLATYSKLDGGNIANFPFGASPNTWDFGATFMPDNGSISYYPVSDNFFAGTHVFGTGSRTLFGANMDIEYYWLKNADLFGESAWKIYASSASLAPFSGGANDAIVIPEQKQIFDEPRVVLDFPVTMGYTRSSDSRRVINFVLTLQAYGYNNTPCQAVTHLLRADTVVAYGKMSVYTPQGPSQFYDVLAMQSWQHELDSFYVDGMPAPPALLAAFGMSQNQSEAADSNNRMYFYRENHSAPLMLLNFGSDPFTTYYQITVHGDGLQVAGNEELEQGNYQVFVYPNPGVANQQRLKFIGKEVNKASYQVHDLQGKLIYDQPLSMVLANQLEVYMGSEAEAGTYLLTVKDANQQVIAKEQINISK